MRRILFLSFSFEIKNFGGVVSYKPLLKPNLLKWNKHKMMWGVGWGGGGEERRGSGREDEIG